MTILYATLLGRTSAHISQIRTSYSHITIIYITEGPNHKKKVHLHDMWVMVVDNELLFLNAFMF